MTFYRQFIVPAIHYPNNLEARQFIDTALHSQTIHKLNESEAQKFIDIMFHRQLIHRQFIVTVE